MRVTHQLVSQTVNHNLGSSLRRLHAMNDRLSTGKKVRVPSDDPIVVEAGMRLRTAIGQHEQYKQNVSDAKAWLGLTESSLNQIGEGLHRAREQAVAGASSTLTAADRRAIVTEVEQILADIFDIGNTKMDDRFIFGGTRTNKPPFEFNTDYEYVGAPGASASNDESRSLRYEIAPGVTLRVGVHGDETIMPIIESLQSLLHGLSEDDTKAINDALVEIDSAMDNLLRWRAEIGARMNRLDLAEARYSEDVISMEELLSTKEDIDYAGEIMRLKLEENVYRAALATGARIMQPTLVEFLR